MIRTLIVDDEPLEAHGGFAVAAEAGHGGAAARLVCGTELRLSRRYRDKVRAYLAR